MLVVLAAFCAALRAAFCDSPVGGGIRTGIVRGLLGGGYWGVKLYGLAAMVKVMGLTC